MKVTRIEVGRLDAPEKTPQGFLRVPAHLTRAGVLTYYNADGSERREYVPTSEVMRSDSLATLISAPVTMLHPPEMVTPGNREKYDRGNVGDNILRDGGKVAAQLYIKDSRLITAVERGDMREASCGYVCNLDMTPGVVPEGEPDAGQKYDAKQMNRVYNHVAVVPQGRAGHEVKLHLDAAGQAVVPRFDNLPTEDKHMVKERIDGVDYEVGTEPHKAAVARRDEAAKQAKAEADAKQARLDKAEADLKIAQKKLDELPKELEQKAKERADLLDQARKVLGAEFKFDGLDPVAIRLEVAKKANPEMKLDGKPEAYIQALYDMALAGVEEHTDDDNLAQVRADALGRGGKGKLARTDAVSNYEQAIKESEEAGRNLWRRSDEVA